MSGNQMQITAKSNIDAVLTGNPSITFFKSVYRKHTNFSMEDMVIGTIQAPLTGAKYPVKIPVGTGDLLSGTSYIIRGNKTYCGNGIANISTAVIDNIAFVINSREIDKTYGHYLEVYHELNQDNPNSTISNLGRIEDSSLYHLANNANLAALATHKSMINNNISDTSYFDNSISKPTNIMGSGACSYPPTHFQKLSKCAGTYCAPTYLQEQDSLQPTGTDINASYSSNYNYVSSLNTIPTSSGHVSGMNRSRFNASLINYTQGGSSNATFTYNVTKGLNQFIKGATYTTIHSDLTNFTVDSVSDNVVNISGSEFATSTKFNGSLIEFRRTEKVYSADLLNASQISDSKYKGDILGDCTVPLNFWYCKTAGMSIPLCALSNSIDVELYFQFSGKNDADWSNNITSISNQHLTYDHNINNSNDIVNSYRLSDTHVKPICDDSKTKFQFNVDIAVTYIYLDNMERKRFSQSSHEYLIEQLQVHYENGQTNPEIDISSFQNPIKELIWCGQPYLKSNIKNITNDNPATSDIINKLNTGEFAHKSGIRWVYGNSNDNCIYGGGIQNSSYSKGFGNASFIGTLEEMTGKQNSGVTTFSGGNDWSNIGNGRFVQGLLGPSTPDCLDYVTYKIKFDSTDRCQARPLQYFTRENVYKYHKGGSISVPDSIAVFSFALNPNDSAPSGTCNFSNINDIKIERGTPGAGSTSNIKYKKVIVYAINYNILRFVHGQAGLSYF